MSEPKPVSHTSQLLGSQPCSLPAGPQPERAFLGSGVLRGTMTGILNMLAFLRGKQELCDCYSVCASWVTFSRTPFVWAAYHLSLCLHKGSLLDHLTGTTALVTGQPLSSWALFLYLQTGIFMAEGGSRGRGRWPSTVDTNRNT